MRIRKDYWVDVYVLRNDLLRSLDKCNIDFTASIVLTPSPLSSYDRLKRNGAIVLNCDDPEFPDLPTSICTPLGDVKLFLNPTRLRGNNLRGSNLKGSMQAVIEQVTEEFGLVPVKDFIFPWGESFHRYAVTRLPWNPTVAFQSPNFVGVPRETNEIAREFRRIKRMEQRYLKNGIFHFC